MIEGVWRDVRYAGRSLRRSPGFALVAILTLAAGVGSVVWRSGELEHCHHDTFRAVWEDEVLGRSFLSFSLDSQARVRGVQVGGIEDFERVRD